MSEQAGSPERVLILASLGRDAKVAAQVLHAAGIQSLIAASLAQLCHELKQGAGVALITSEALATTDLTPLLAWISEQPAWSDLPIVLMTLRNQIDPTPAMRLAARLGNVTLLERPFHPGTLTGLINTALRGRRRQYESLVRQEDLAESERRLHDALTAGRLGAWQLDVNKRRLDCSTLSKAHFGREPTSPFDLDDWLACIHAQDRPVVEQALDASLERGIDLVLQFRNVWPDGSVNWADMRARAVMDEHRRVTVLVGVSSDITQRKYAERQLQQLNENLEQQVQERTAQVLENEDALRQAQKMEAVGQLTGGIAHDFNNMLTGVIGSLELMRRRLARGRGADIDNLIDMGLASANRAANLTHRLLAFSRRQALDSKPVNINELVLSMESLLQRSLNESVQLEMRLSDDIWIAEADPHQLESALLNLVINARDAMPTGGKLLVETLNGYLDSDITGDPANQLIGEYVVLSVSDTGCGMPESVIKQAFDPFFTTKPMGQGTGLGLSMIYGFSKQSHGHVAIHSEVDIGTTVSLYLPRHQGVTITEAPRAPALDNRARNGETVLVVEDDSAVRALLGEALSELGYGFIPAEGAETAMHLLSSNQRIDLLISDLGLPGMNGRQLARWATDLRPGLKVLFVTGHAEDTVAAGEPELANQVITKPFTFDVLTAKVREMTRAS